MFFEHSKNVLRECSANVREAFAECFTRMLVQHSAVSTRRRFGEHSANITQMFAQHLANIIWLAGQSPLDQSSCSQRHQFVRPASVYFEVAASTRSVWRSTSASIQSSDHFQNLPRLKCLVGFYTAIDNTWRYSSVAVYICSSLCPPLEDTDRYTYCDGGKPSSRTFWSDWTCWSSSW